MTATKTFSGPDIGVLLEQVQATAVRKANHHRGVPTSSRAVTVARHMADNLVQTRVHKAAKLQLHHRLVTHRAHADGGADDTFFGEWGVEDSSFAVLALKSGGDAENTAHHTHVLAVHHHFVIALERKVQFTHPMDITALSDGHLALADGPDGVKMLGGDLQVLERIGGG